MSSQQQRLAWPKQEIPTEADGAPTPGGVAAGKNRSPRATASGVARARVAFDAMTRDEGGERPRESEPETGDRSAGHAPSVRQYVFQPASWSTRVIRSSAEFEALRGAWSELLSESEDSSVFLSHEWLFAWWSAYRPEAELAIVLAEENGRLCGIAPMMTESSRRAGVTRKVLRFIGDGTGETDHIHFLTAVSRREDAMRVLLDAIGNLEWDVAEFNQVPEGTPNSLDLLDWIDRMRFRSSLMVKPCPVRRLPASYEELLAGLPGRLRTSIRSSRKKLEQKHRVEFGLHEKPEDLGPALEAFFTNHESRWQGKGQSGAFANEMRRDFYAGLTPRLLERGWLRFFYLKLDGRTVAQQYCFALDGTVMLLQEGFDFAHAQDNVGNVLRAMVFEHLINTGATCYDFLAGSSRHKKSWSDGEVNDLCIHCARRSWRGWLFFALPLKIERVKDALRPWRDRLFPRQATAAE
jgi:CelD/BcsL family acetyltransferase involved in cellulose biosynthesis